MGVIKTPLGLILTDYLINQVYNDIKTVFPSFSFDPILASEIFTILYHGRFVFPQKVPQEYETILNIIKEKKLIDQTKYDYLSSLYFTILLLTNSKPKVDVKGVVSFFNPLASAQRESVLKLMRYLVDIPELVGVIGNLGESGTERETPIPESRPTTIRLTDEINSTTIDSFIPYLPSKAVAIDKINSRELVDYNYESTNRTKLFSIAIDYSSSMNEPIESYPKSSYAKLLAYKFITDHVKEGKVRAIGFTEKILFEREVTESNLTHVVDEIMTTPPFGGTSIDEALKRAIRNANLYNDKAVLFVTDGESPINEETRKQVIYNEITVNAIIITQNREDVQKFVELAKLTKDSGGKMYVVDSVESLKNLR